MPLVNFLVASPYIFYTLFTYRKCFRNTHENFFPSLTIFDLQIVKLSNPKTLSRSINLSATRKPGLDLSATRKPGLNLSSWHVKKNRRFNYRTKQKKKKFDARNEMEIEMGILIPMHHSEKSLINVTIPNLTFILDSPHFPLFNLHFQPLKIVSFVFSRHGVIIVIYKNSNLYLPNEAALHCVPNLWIKPSSINAWNSVPIFCW